MGMSVIPTKFTDGTILINGVIESLLNSTCPSHLRKTYRSHKIMLDTIKRWHSIMLRVGEQIEEVVSKNVAEAIASLHDIKTATNLVFRNAEALIQQIPGATDEERIENSSATLKSLYKSVSLLNTRLNMSSYVSNPQAASFGSKRPIPVYRVVDRICRLFDEIAAKKNVRIAMSGSSYNRVQCYDSFETLALVLVDNAVKYSLGGETVNVFVRDVGGGVEVKVESKGPVIPSGERELIFERGYRTSGATKMVSGGSGLGLYIAKNIADAHNIKVQYEVRDSNSQEDIGTNIFFFRVDTTSGPGVRH
jgi:signal transduction histidine kinase